MAKFHENGEKMEKSADLMEFHDFPEGEKRYEFLGFSHISCPKH